MKTIPIKLSEIEADFNATKRDIEALQQIVSGLNTFIAYSHKEDRSKFRIDLFKYETLLRQGRELQKTIENYLQHARSNPKP